MWLFTSTSAVIAAVCVGVYYSELQNLQQSMKVDQEQKLEQKQQFILSDFETAIADLHILAGDPDLLDALIGEGELDTDGDAEAKQVDRRDVRSLLLAFLSSRNLYRQARLLDRDGRETLRIEQRQGQIHIVPEEELQDKSNRPYFKESRSLKPGEVYVSPLNLNVEDGAIERPFVPVIRFAKPLLDRNGDLQGVLVLNYQGDRLLRRLDEHEQYISYLSNIDLDDFPSRSHLVNGTGHWLKHHEPEREWGFLLPERSGQSLPQQNSGLWEAMQRRSQGSFVSDDSTYTFLKLPIFSLVQKYNLLGRVVVNHEAAQGYNWRVLIATPKGAITEKMSPLGRELLVNWLMLSALLATGLWSWFLARQQKEQVQQDLVESQEELALQQEQADVLNQRLSSQIRDSLDSEAVISTAIAEVFNLLQGDRCSFAWVDADEEVWDVVYSAKKKHLDDFSNQSFDRAPLIRAFERCELLCVNDVNGLENREIRGVLRRYGYRSVLASRVATQFGRTGVILCGAAKVRSWSTLDIELLKGVSEQVAIALNQAELFQKSQKSELEAHDALAALKKAQTQLIRSEKMSGLGQLVAGVAHEINNPVNFIFGNVEYVTDYVNDLIQLMEEYQRHISPLPPELKEMQEELEWDFIQTDLPKVLQSMRMGAERIQAIVKSLRTFSRLDEADQKVG
ncbi:MAG: GAF domain-containing protein [Cyanobacteria bacterium P01_D01_bin.73]